MTYVPISEMKTHFPHHVGFSPGMIRRGDVGPEVNWCSENFGSNAYEYKHASLNTERQWTWWGTGDTDGGGFYFKESTAAVEFKLRFCD